MRTAVAFIALTVPFLLGANSVFAQTRGQASYYSHAGRTASGEAFQPNGLTAAHRTLPFGTRVRVTEVHNRRSVVVRINDRSPFKRGRIIDVSHGAAKALGITGRGLAMVELEVLR